MICGIGSKHKTWGQEYEGHDRNVGEYGTRGPATNRHDKRGLMIIEVWMQEHEGQTIRNIWDRIQDIEQTQLQCHNQDIGCYNNNYGRGNKFLGPKCYQCGRRGHFARSYTRKNIKN